MIHIKKFLQRVQSARTSNQKQLILTLQEAEQLGTDISIVLSDLAGAQHSQNKSDSNQVVEVEIKGNTW
jgi:hypothetical protein